MDDRELVKIARDFRRGLIGRKPSKFMCFAVCAPLAGLLRHYGEDAEIIEGRVTLDIGIMNHFWIGLPDGRVLDPTADQFGLAPIYLGPPTEFHTELKDA